MRFGFSNTPAQPFGRRGAGDREHPAADAKSLGNMRRERPAQPAGRAADPVDAAAAPGRQVNTRLEAPDPGAAANFEHHAEGHLDRSSPLAPSVDTGGPLARGSVDSDDRFAGLASPSPLAAELAAGHDDAARSRAADAAGGQH